ncbi:MAG: peptide chain release factor N(5)-glutamine methyltransferase [Actinomycetota bacterium]
MRPAAVARRGADYLARHGVVAPAAESETLLQGILELDRASLFTRQRPLSPGESRAFGRALCRRCTGTPLQHLTGEQGFRRLVLEVRPGVFVPRPETEIVVDIALEMAPQAQVVVDLCTGSGAIALAIADEHPGAAVFATDASAEAVGLARANASRLGLVVTVAHGDLFEPLPPRLHAAIDLVVANPPYLPADDGSTLPADVRADPSSALFGGIDLYERLFADALEWLGAGGAVVVEIDAREGSAVSAAARAAGFTEVRVLRDLTGRDRVVTGRRP